MANQKNHGIQEQNVYPDIDPNDPDALYKVLELARQTWRKLTELNARLSVIEDKLEI
jgi:AmiR/NasT family two-component response regulator